VARNSATSLSGLGRDIWTGGDCGVPFNACLASCYKARSFNSARLFRSLVCYAAMLADFFIFNLPVNEALRGWTPVTLPPD